MNPVSVNGQLPAHTRAFYRRVLQLLDDAEAPFLVGGAYAFARHTGIERHTKDLDLFVRPEDCRRVLDILAGAGFRTDIPFPHWLGKAYGDGDFIDVIFSSGNGVCRVDDVWFEHALEGEVFGLPVRLCPLEETIWSKSFVLERERYDGADVAHLLRAGADRLNWGRLLERFGPNWRVLLSHLVLFGYIYPGERHRIPAAVMKELLGRLGGELAAGAAGDRACRGTLLSREQYLPDVERWGYTDPRLGADGLMSRDELRIWTAAIEAEPAPPGDGTAVEVPAAVP